MEQGGLLANHRTLTLPLPIAVSHRVLPVAVVAQGHKVIQRRVPPPRRVSDMRRLEPPIPPATGAPRLAALLLGGQVFPEFALEELAVSLLSERHEAK